MPMVYQLIDQLEKKHKLSSEEFLYLLNNLDTGARNYLITKAQETRLKYYGKKVFLRGLIEFTNYCTRNCKYCGIRAANGKVERYRLTLEQIIATCAKGYELGYRTFVLQGGEDTFYTDEMIVNLVEELKNRFPNCALTLSIGEKSYQTYKRYFDAGVDRYLLRHETASEQLYEALHPGMNFENRRQCLWDLKKIGYQVGAGFMVGLPRQTNEDFVADLEFLQELQPQMVGIGPFIPHGQTPLANSVRGTFEETIVLLAVTRLLLPEVLLPATTALGTIDPQGRELGLKAGANVVMPNLSPVEVRDKYALYDNKAYTQEEAAECREYIAEKIVKSGLVPDLSRGDCLSWHRRQA